MKAKNSTPKTHSMVKIPLLAILAILCNYNNLFSQETRFSDSAITFGFALTAIKGGEYPENWSSHHILDKTKLRGGAGLGFWLGWQKNIGSSNKLRINPGISLITMLEHKDFFDVLTPKPPLYLLQCNLHYDLLNFGRFTIVGTIGTFAGFQIITSETSYRQRYTVYTAGGNVALGFRFPRPLARAAFEVRPVILEFDSKHLIYGIGFIKQDFRLNKKYKP